MDLFSDGVMIGAGSSVSFSLAILFALGQVAGDIPEGFALVANFKEKGVARRTRLLVSAAFVLPILAGTALSFLLVQGRPEIVQFSLLAFTAGILMTVIVEEVLPEAHSGAASRIATVALVGGFVLFALLAAYLG